MQLFADGSSSMIPELFCALVLPYIVHGFPTSSLATRSNSTASEVSQSIRETWKNPSDTLSILLIIGGDVVLKALAQLSGRAVTPVAFSFGWVTYSFNTLMAVLGDGRLMPPPDYAAKVINAKTGFVRDNRSWVLGRLFRDFKCPLEPDISLIITVFEAALPATAQTIPERDWYWWSGIITMGLQLGLAAIPLGLYGDWTILTMTSAGTLLSLATGALPQWHYEKWACRRKTNKIICITGGNGSRSVMVIFGAGVGLDLEDLAGAESPMVNRRNNDVSTPSIFSPHNAFIFTQASCMLLAVLWIVFLITVTGMDQSAWYLLLVGGLGMVQNVVVAGAKRGISTSGIHLEKIEEFKGKKVMHSIMDLEEAYPTVGKPLLNEFFPNAGGLRPAEEKWWAGNKTEYEESRGERPQIRLSSRAANLRKRHLEGPQKNA